MITGIDMEIVVRLVVALVLGTVLGIERSIVGKHAGMRTYALVAMGSAQFVVLGILSAYQFSLFAGVNPLQLAGFVIVGIGFVGSGLAVFRGEHPAEITTAAGLWVAAGVGMAAGFGYYAIAIAATVCAVLVFSVFLKLENTLRRRFGAQNN